MQANAACVFVTNVGQKIVRILLNFAFLQAYTKILRETKRLQRPESPKSCSISLNCS